MNIQPFGLRGSAQEDPREIQETSDGRLFRVEDTNAYHHSYARNERKHTMNNTEENERHRRETILSLI